MSKFVDFFTKEIYNKASPGVKDFIDAMSDFRMNFYEIIEKPDAELDKEITKIFAGLTVEDFEELGMLKKTHKKKTDRIKKKKTSRRLGWKRTKPYDVIEDPQLSQGDIPQLLQGDESSTSIEVSNLAGKILSNEKKFGLLILESGNSSIVQWKCGTTPLPLPVYFSKQSTLVSAFTSALPFYHFDFSLYNGDPQKVLLFPPTSLLSFSASSSSFDVSSSCLIFAFILWDPSLVPLEDDTQPVAFNVSQCSNCASLPLTNQAFRLCPSVSSESASFTSPTESTPNSVSTQGYHPNGVKVIEPSIVDSTVESKVMMELQNPIDPKDMRGCKILSKTREIDIELDTKDVSSTRFALTVPAGVQPDNYYVLCSVDNADWSAHNWSLSVFDFRELTQLKDYSVEETQKAVIPRFIQPLPSQFSQDFYCQDDSGRYESLNASSLICSIRENSNRIWITVPTQTVRPSTSSPQIRSTLPSRDSCFARLNDDLLGLSLEATDGCFPEDSSICMGDSNSASVAFGSFPSLLPHSSITVKCLKSCKTTVEEPLNPIAPSFVVKYPEKTLSCGNAVFDIRQVFGDGRQSMQYQWKIRGPVDGLDPQLVNLINSFESRNLSIPCSWITRSLSLQVTACNFVSRCTTSSPLNISPSSSASLLSVSVSGLSSSVPYPSLPLVLTAEAVFYTCNGTFLPNDVRFNWFVNDSLAETSRQLVIPEFSYASFDLLAIRLTAEYQDESDASAHLKAEDERTITFGQMSLIGSVDCSYWTVAEEVELKVDGSSSRNPNDREGSVKHEWSCIEQKTREDICKQEAVNTHSAILRIPKGTLKANMIVNVSDVVTASNLSASSNCIISVVSEQIPQVDFQQLADTKINIDDYARINGIVERAICPLEVTWSVVTDNEITDFFDISQFLSSASTTFNNLSNMDVLVSLTIPPYLPELYPKWTGLQAGRKYRIRLSAKSPKGKSYSDIILTTNSPPQIGIIDISPFPPVSLSSPIVLSAGDGWTDPDLPLSYRFSVITYFDDNSTSTSSFPRSSTSFQTVFLPSADSSSQRDSYMVSLSVCDRYSSCSSSFSSPFTVLPPQNVSLAAQHLLTSINADVSNGNMLDAVDKVVVINEEINKMTIDMDTADRLVQMLLDTINNRSESILYVRVLDSSMKMLDIISPNTVSKITKAVDAYRLMKGGTQLKKKGDRQKRDVDNTDSGGSPNQVSTQDAHDMLRMYDMLLEKNQAVTDVFLLNIGDHLSAFCVQLDANSNRIIQAKGQGYTAIQAQSVNPSVENFTQIYYKIAGNAAERLNFSSSFGGNYTQYLCGVDLMCFHVCLATASISSVALSVNSDFQSHFFSPGSTPTLNQSVSDLYQISLLNPQTGDPISSLPIGIILYSVYIPLKNFTPSAYYGCFIYSSNSWDVKFCSADLYPVMFDDDVRSLRCSCTQPGMLRHSSKIYDFRQSNKFQCIPSRPSKP
ncbi:hypothetical protein WR25_21320 [Diploscapter pachys]|uniref:PKD/REJ-like domain-containing protein n=1 Tax=Diploscapter pachys TaxID=2018661 RepID=A0A2A2J3I8_9BILA|nr:hypothetical protein WR25_21320 [Diploscapter pachys]